MKKVSDVKLFPTFIHQSILPGYQRLNSQLLSEMKIFSSKDRLGRAWSKDNYVKGYTSYGSLSDMHHRSRPFLALQEILTPLAESFSRNKLGWSKISLEMNSCWFNKMGPDCQHSLHFHPHSVLSGAYFVKTPRGCGDLRLEDPRSPLYMNAPLRQKEGMELYYRIQPREGLIVLFESWLKHEVTVNRSKAERVSISFNFSGSF